MSSSSKKYRPYFSLAMIEAIVQKFQNPKSHIENEILLSLATLRIKINMGVTMPSYVPKSLLIEEKIGMTPASPANVPLVNRQIQSIESAVKDQRFQDGLMTPLEKETYMQEIMHKISIDSGTIPKDTQFVFRNPLDDPESQDSPESQD